MHLKLVAAMIMGLVACAHAQLIQDPLRDGAKAGSTYLVWKTDVDHDGVLDVLISEKQSAEDVQDLRSRKGPSLPEDAYTFAVYIGVRDGSGYQKAGGISVETSHCYVGYIREVKQYGIVTLEVAIVDDPAIPQAKHGILSKQVCAYTLDAGQMRKIDLTPPLGDWEKSPVYSAYLTDAKRTKVQIDEVTP